MRWQGQELGDVRMPRRCPDSSTSNGLVRTVTTPEFAGMTFHEVLCEDPRSTTCPAHRAMPFAWTINPYRGCSHACVYCFARGTHEYLDLDAGRDFDSQIVVKINVGRGAPEGAAQRGSWQHETVALGTNTDPYQRAEGRYRLMPGIIDALADSGTPFSILTKGTLLRRDLPLLAEAAAARARRPSRCRSRCTTTTLQKSIEPGTPTTPARLDTVRAAARGGLPGARSS